MKKSELKIFMISFLAILVITFIVFYSYRPEPDTVKVNGDGCLVLSYHRVLPSNAFISFLYQVILRFTDSNELELYSVTAQDFEEQIKFLIEREVRFLSLKEFHEYRKGNLSIPDRSVLITFDDVDDSVYHNAFPILKEYNIPFVIFPITGHVAEDDFKGLNLANWDQINEMMSSGLAAIGSHSHNYHYLDKSNNPPFLRASKLEAFKQDAILSKKVLELYYDLDYFSYCYPYGHGTDLTDQALIEVGYESIFILGDEVITKDYSKLHSSRILLTQYSWETVVEWVEEDY